jgi:crotonobetainyl-CoA:carnitine CoA-transferase CaiB-like acyl-CoA transferase
VRNFREFNTLSICREARVGSSGKRRIYTSRANNQQWERLLKIIGHEELKDDPLYATPQLRVQMLDEINAAIEAWRVRHTKRVL